MNKQERSKQLEALVQELVEALEHIERLTELVWQGVGPVTAEIRLAVEGALEKAKKVLDYGPVELGEKMSEIQKRVITAVLLERKRQDIKWGEQNHPPHYWTGILGEEYGELCEAINETIFDNGSDKGGYENMRTEAIHVAAVAIGFLECLERNKVLWFPSPNRGTNQGGS